MDHNLGQDGKKLRFSREFCHSGPIGRYGPKGVIVRNTLDVRTLLALGQFARLAHGPRGQGLLRRFLPWEGKRLY